MRMKNPHSQTVSAGELPKEKYDGLEQYIDCLETKKGSLIHVLHKAQEIFGYLPREVQLFIARKLGISGAEVFGTVSFYSYFTTNPVGKHTISVCMGTACFVKGAENILEKIKARLDISTNETTKDGLFTLKDIRCLGTCSLAPVVMIDDKVFGNVTEEDVEGILEGYFDKEGRYED